LHFAPLSWPSSAVCIQHWWVSTSQPPRFCLALNALMESYVHPTYSWPDYWRGFRTVSTVALLLANSATLRYSRSGKCLNAYAIAANYGRRVLLPSRYKFLQLQVSNSLITKPPFILCKQTRNFLQSEAANSLIRKPHFILCKQTRIFLQSVVSDSLITIPLFILCKQSRIFFNRGCTAGRQTGHVEIRLRWDRVTDPMIRNTRQVRWDI
jgi:hypothetical protein